MSGRPTRRGRQSQANKRGQAGSVSRGNSAGCGHGASSSAPGRVEPQHAEDLVEWMTKLSSSSSSFLTQAQGTLSGKAAANAASSLGSMASVSSSLAPPCPPEESPELFDHSVKYMLQEDAQRFEGSDDGTQLEEGSNVSPKRGGAQEGQQSGSHVPPAAAYCQLCSSDEEGGDNEEVTDSMWVPDRREKEEEAHLQRGRMPSRGLLKGSTPTASHRRAPHVQALLSLHVIPKVLWCGPFLRRVHQIALLLFATYVSSVSRVTRHTCSSLASVPKRPTPKNKADLSLLLISWDLQPHYTFSPL
ncbi:hypothetical protein AB205_0174750 [Aquarana catesbeiana]|uniref:Uncharacterized protein n=1 Tax=Aquarana catesbeiana TaxID=8400 RepID=A0A2G9RAL1_AQUCT|nr:hypothetical protein AB205_0174750 [Aquarana catesbeiana]